MFKTTLGASSDSNMELFLRPETAQGIFLNYLTLQKTSRMKIPFGIAQTGKAFRNEIVARQFIFRMREFEQMEMQFFIKPGTQEQWYKEWKDKRMKWHLSLGFEEKKYRFHDHENLAHYADAASDIEFNFPFGFKELEGIHSRTDFDLKSHEKLSGKKIQYFDTDKNESYTPYVIETSIGLDRMFLSVLSNSYSNETLEDGSSRVVLKIPKQIAPIKLAVLPLLKKDDLLEIAKELINEFSSEVNLSYDEKDAIGRRYRRQDAIGTPYCVTIDHQTLEDNTFTLRDRDSMKQKRINNKDLKNIIEKELTLNSLLNNLK
jgi:glycyl-tRNA synthetase